MRSQPPQGASRTMAEREKSGRFAKGNAGGPGNPFAAQVAKLRAVILACLPEETMQVIVQAMIRQAMRGDVAAAKLLFQYALGKPIEVPLPEAEAEVEAEEPEEEAVSKREETVKAEQADAVNKREEAAAGTESKREETAEMPSASTVNKRRETVGGAVNKRGGTGRSLPVEVGAPGAVGERVRELFGELVNLWAEDTGRTARRPEVMPVGG